MHNAAIDVCLDKVCIIAVCANLPGDWPLRVRLFQNGRAFEPEQWSRSPSWLCCS